MVQYNSNHTVFRRGLDWYILPKGEGKPRWFKRYVRIPISTQHSCQAMTSEERDRLQEIYEEYSYSAFAEVCEYLSWEVWSKRRASSATVRREIGRRRFEG